MSTVQLQTGSAVNTSPDFYLCNFLVCYGHRSESSLATALHKMTGSDMHWPYYNYYFTSVNTYQKPMLKGK